MKFSIIVATDTEGGIGLKDDHNNYCIPWKSSIDMKFFKDTTSKTNNSDKKNAVIMGRNTYLSLPEKNNSRGLSNRYNIVISSQPELFNKDKSVICVSSLNLAIDKCIEEKNIENIFVIGGSRLYEEALKHPNLEYVYWNLILETENKCNIFFPITMSEIGNICFFDNNYDLIQMNNSELQFNKFIKKDCNAYESKYLDILKEIITNGDERSTRNSITNFNR